MRRYFYIVEHQGKEKKYVKALENGDFVRAMQPNHRTKIALVDYDMKQSRQEKMRYWKDRYGISKFFVYPHAARVNVIGDIYPSWEHTNAQFVTTSAHAEIMRLYGYVKPVYPVGWTLCDLVTTEFQRRTLEKVVFAPIHPRMSCIDMETNRQAFMLLSRMAKEGKFELTVRFIHGLENSGLPPAREYPWVTFVEGRQDGSIEMIDQASLVVSHQTYAYLAIARKVPTLMMNEHIPPKDFTRDGTILYVKNWDAYRHLLQYPLDILNTPDPYGLMQHACETDADIQEWRENNVGSKMFDEHEFLHRIRVHT